jgi:hypothetical protein
VAPGTLPSSSQGSGPSWPATTKQFVDCFAGPPSRGFPSPFRARDSRAPRGLSRPLFAGHQRGASQRSNLERPFIPIGAPGREPSPRRARSGVRVSAFRFSNRFSPGPVVGEAETWRILPEQKRMRLELVPTRVSGPKFRDSAGFRKTETVIAMCERLGERLTP